MDQELSREQLDQNFTDATTTLATTKEQMKASKEVLKEAKVGVKNIEAALKALPHTTENEVERKKGLEALEVSQGHVTETQAKIEELRIALDAATEALRLAKVARKGAPAAPKVQREKRNGMTLPAPNSISGVLWAVYDEVTAEKGSTAAFQEVFEKAQATGNKDATIRAAYAHWRKFHGVTGRVVPAKVAALEPAAPTCGMPAPHAPEGDELDDDQNEDEDEDE